MHFYNDRSPTLIIYTAKKPSRTAYKTAPPITMAPACGFPIRLCQAENEKFLRETRELGYLVTIDHEFFRFGNITCSDKTRHVSAGLLYYCLLGEAEQHIGANPKDFIYRPENARRYLTLDYQPHPDDLLWKPYMAILSFNETSFHFMALTPDNQLLTASITFPKLAFSFEFDIIYHKLNQRENYICRWSPTENPFNHGPHAPFHVHYELIFNTDLNCSAIARRTADYNAFPGVRPSHAIHNTRVYGRELVVLDADDGQS